MEQTHRDQPDIPKTAHDRERRLAQTFVQLADTLTNGFDVVELFDDLVRSCVELLELAAAGLLLADQRGALRVMAFSSEQTRLLELFELQNNEGPCLDCFRTGVRVVALDADQLARWPAFATQLRSVGLGPAYALPMRLRDRTIGALNLFRATESPLADHDLDIGQAMADIATIAILQHRAQAADRQLAEQLQVALNSRIAIEQAKGVVAEHAEVDMDTAFVSLRAYARSNNTSLSRVAMAVAGGELAPERIVAPPPRGGSTRRPSPVRSATAAESGPHNPPPTGR